MVSQPKADRPRWPTTTLLVGPCVLAGVVVLLFVALLPARGYAVSKELRVSVRVADKDTLQGLANVPVVVFRGHEAHYDTEWAGHIALPLLDEVEHEQFVTGESGSVEFGWPFHAVAGKNAFGTYGGFVSNTWVQITPPGYGEVLLPLDGQTAQRRDFGDESPVVVTVLLKKSKDD